MLVNAGLKIIYKNRPKKATSARAVGGGVSIIFRRANGHFRESKIVGNKFELVLAIGKVGKVGKVQRLVAVACVYLEPRLKAAQLERIRGMINREILALKAKLDDPLIFVGGDLN